MKRYLVNIIAVLILLLQITSCKKIAQAIFGGLDVSVADLNVSVPPVPYVAPFEIPLGEFPYKFNLDSIVRAKTGNSFGAGDVTSIKVKQLSITISNPDPLNNLANFEKVRVTIQSNTNSSPAELFSATFPDTYAATFMSAGNNVELLSYLKGSNIIYKMYGKNRRITTQTLNLVMSVIVRAS